MCKVKPFPRCSDHARKNLAAVRANKSSTREQIAEAEHEWQISPAGIKEAREAGNHFQADLRTAERAAIVAVAKRHFAGKRSSKAVPLVTADDEGVQGAQVNSDLGDKDERLAAAKNPRTKYDVVKKLVSDEDTYVRIDVAWREDITPEDLDILSSDDAAGVRMAVARNGNTSTATLDFLSTDPSIVVRSVVAENRSTSASTLIRLSEDEKEAVRAYAKKNIESPEYHERLAFELMNLGMARDDIDNLPLDVLHAML